MKVIKTIGILLLLLPGTAAAQRFLPDDPIWHDPDEILFPEPREIDLSKLFDFLENTFLIRPDSGEIPRALNVNTLGEVPDSSWFSNRLGRRPMSIEELIRGPDQLNGPDLSSGFTIISAKPAGIMPGFVARDSRGEVFFVKIDPFDSPQLATSAEVISTKFFHAFGYHVPENYLAFVHPEDLRLDPSARAREGRKRRPMTPQDLEQILSRSPRLPDGTIQLMASRRLPGRDLGPFKYYGTRADDPNDIFPHEHRRELRGLRVFSAWLNHDDARADNTINIFITPESENNSQPRMGFIRHHLLDFGSCLGSGSTQPQSLRGGNEYIVEWPPILRAALTFGIWDRPWRSIAYPDFSSIGRFEADHFEPHLWRPEYPNAAFERMLPDDAFWASRILMHLEDEQIRAVVKTGRLLHPEAEDYLVRTLIQRRDKIVRYYLGLINPLHEFEIVPEAPPSGPQGGAPGLRFANLGQLAGLADDTRYEYQWFSFDNRTGATEPLSELRFSDSPEVPLISSPAAFLMVRIRSHSEQQPAWSKAVEVYLRNTPTPSVVGIDREI